MHSVWKLRSIIALSEFKELFELVTPKRKAKALLKTEMNFVTKSIKTGTEKMEFISELTLQIFSNISKVLLSVLVLRFFTAVNCKSTGNRKLIFIISQKVENKNILILFRFVCVRQNQPSAEIVGFLYNEQ